MNNILLLLRLKYLCITKVTKYEYITLKTNLNIITYTYTHSVYGCCWCSI